MLHVSKHFLLKRLSFDVLNLFEVRISEMKKKDLQNCNILNCSEGLYLKFEECFEDQSCFREK